AAAHADRDGQRVAHLHSLGIQSAARQARIARNVDENAVRKDGTNRPRIEDEIVERLVLQLEAHDPPALAERGLALGDLSAFEKGAELLKMWGPQDHPCAPPTPSHRSPNRPLSKEPKP